LTTGKSNGENAGIRRDGVKLIFCQAKGNDVHSTKDLQQLLSICDLVKVYPGPVTALQGINLEVPPGMFGLLGPNGAGKSTLMRILAGLLEATSGRVMLDDIDVLKHPDRVWPHLGFLPQEFGFYPHLTGTAMLDFLLQMKGVQSPRSRKVLVGELLDRVNLAGVAHRKIRDYSGGMRQRLGIAQAISGDPRLVIVDEPTAGLDPEERQRFYRLLSELSVDRTVFLSTHIVEDVAVLCPRFAIIKQGRVVLQTTPQAARAALEGDVFAGQVEAGEVESLKLVHDVTQSTIFEGIAQVRLLVGAAGPPSGFIQVPPSLEDVYLVAMNGRKINTSSRTSPEPNPQPAEIGG
jgi:ABC-2 type transport system ATP-binding protein